MCACVLGVGRGVCVWGGVLARPQNVFLIHLTRRVGQPRGAEGGGESRPVVEGWRDVWRGAGTGGWRGEVGDQ